MTDVKTNIAWRIFLVLLMLILLPLGLIALILIDLWETGVNCIKAIEGKPFLTIAEEDFETKIQKYQGRLKDIDEMRRLF